MTTKSIASIAAACGIAATVCAADFFVSPDGDDSANGSREAPFATLERARDAVRSLRKAGSFPKDGVTVWLRGGTYRTRGTLALGAEDGGERGAPVAYRAWNGETPVMSGGWTVPSGAWRKSEDPRIPAEAKGKVWEAHVKDLGYDALERDAPCGFHSPRPLYRIRSLHCNGRHLALARWPNEGFVTTGKVIDAKKGVFTADVGDWTRWSPENSPDLQTLGYWKWLWADETLSVVADPNAKTFRFCMDGASGKNRAHHLGELSAADFSAELFNGLAVRSGMPFCLLNSLAALDAPGEWCLESGSGVLYVRPLRDEPPAGCAYELSRASYTFLKVEKTAHLRFEGIVFRMGRHHGVELRGVSDVAFEGCVVRDFGGNGLIVAGAKDCTVRGNVFHTFGHCAMTLDGGDRRSLAPSGVKVEANEFFDTGLAMRTYTPGIVASGCGHRIVRNYMHDIPSSAMRVAGNEHLVASNLVERVVTESDDQGGVDMWGDHTYRGNKFIHNIWRDIGRGGKFVKCGQAGIRFDDAICGNLVYGNLFDNCSHGIFGGVQIHGGRGNVVRNNVFMRCRHGVSFSQWSQERWRTFVTSESGKAKAKAANVDGAEYRAKYPEYAGIESMPMVNTVEGNLFAGDSRAFLFKSPATTVASGNTCVGSIAPGDLSSVPGFDPLPPESVIGPGNDAMLRSARRRDAALDAGGCGLVK